MKSIAKLKEPIIALHNSISHSINSNNWIEFEGYSDFLIELIGKVADNSISPNRSTILGSLFDIVNSVSSLLINTCEFDQFLMLTEKTFSRYFRSVREKEITDAISQIAGDMVASYFITTIFSEVGILASAPNVVLKQHLKLLDCLKKLHFLFISDYKSWVFEQIVPVYFAAINENATINKDEKTQIINRSTKELFRITERDLGKFHTVKPHMSKDIVIDSYIYDWTSILKQFYLNNDKELIELVFSFMSSSTLGNDLVEKKLYPCLAINLLMIAITDLHYEHGDKVSLLSFDIIGKYNKYNGITDYIRVQMLLTNLELFKCSYLSMAKLVEVWKERSGCSATYDYSPEIFLILVCTFMHNPCNYPEILKWTVVNRLPRCDRFNEIIDEIKKCISKYPDNESNTHIERTFISFTAVFESTLYLLENENTELITNLDSLKNEALSLLSNT